MDRTKKTASRSKLEAESSNKNKYAFSDADFVSLRNRGDVVSPLILKYKS